MEQNVTTANAEEIKKFSDISSDWWNEKGKFAPLHKINPVRIKYIKEKIVNHFNLELDAKQPFQKLEILDIGCGGGLICEPLARLGAKITGIDASAKNIEVAKNHAKDQHLNIEYACSTVENHDKSKKYDVILALEVLEHINNMDLFIENVENLLEKNGVVIFSTINKTNKSYLFAIIGAEYVLKWLPVGTHDWNKFIVPKELIERLKKHHIHVSEMKGLSYSIFGRKWFLSHDLDVNYFLFCRKYD